MGGYRANEEEIVRGLTAVVHCAGNYKRASELLAAEELEREREGLPPSMATYNQATLRDWCIRLHASRYAELRDKYAAELEGGLIHDMRDLAIQGIEAQRIAIEKARERLEDGESDDPARDAAALSRVVQTNVDKMLAVSGRPTSIREDRRNPEEILRGLIAKFPGLIELPPEDVTEEEPPELEAA